MKRHRSKPGKNLAAIRTLATQFARQFPARFRVSAKRRAESAMVDNAVEQMKVSHFTRFYRMWKKTLADIAADQAPKCQRRDEVEKAAAVAALAAHAAAQTPERLEDQVAQ